MVNIRLLLILCLFLLSFEAYGSTNSYTIRSYTNVYTKTSINRYMSGNTTVTNKIAKELKGTMYYAKPTSVRAGKAMSDRGDNALNCVGYAFRVDKIAKGAEIYEVTGNHVIAVVKDEKNKRVCYSNGKVVRESAYTKKRRIK